MDKENQAVLYAHTIENIDPDGTFESHFYPQGALVHAMGVVPVKVQWEEEYLQKFLRKAVLLAAAGLNGVLQDESPAWNRQNALAQVRRIGKAAYELREATNSLKGPALKEFCRLIRCTDDAGEPTENYPKWQNFGSVEGYWRLQAALDGVESLERWAEHAANTRRFLGRESAGRRRDDIVAWEIQNLAATWQEVSGATPTLKPFLKFVRAVLVPVLKWHGRSDGLERQVRDVLFGTKRRRARRD